MWRALIGLSLLGSMGALAHSDVEKNPPAPVATDSPPVGEYWSLRLRYGIAYSSGGETDSGPGLTYQGLTPNDISVQGAGWLGYAGVFAAFQRDGFALFDTTTNPAPLVTSGGLVRFAVQAA